LDLTVPAPPGIGLVALAALIGLVVARAWDRLGSNFAETTLAVVPLTVIIMLAGRAAGCAAKLPVEDCIPLAAVLVVRNAAVAAGVAVAVLGRTDFAVIATACFLTKVPILIAALMLFGLIRRPAACH
jgi:ACR3 family arsenite efflux pump ArsB